MYPVEIHTEERDESALTAKMTAMRQWLDHRRVEPQTFRYTFNSPGLVIRVDFEIEAEAAEFAAQFGGQVVLPAYTETMG